MRKKNPFLLPGILIGILIVAGVGLILYDHMRTREVVYIEVEKSPDQGTVATQSEQRFILKESEKLQTDEENTGTGKNSDASALEQLIDEINEETKNNTDIVDP